MPKNDDIRKDPTSFAALKAKETLGADAVVLVAIGGPHSGTAVLCAEATMPHLLDVLKTVVANLEAHLEPRPTLQ